MSARPSCTCSDAWQVPGRELLLHEEQQDTSTDAWKRLLDLVEDTAAKRGEELNPRQSLGAAGLQGIVTLPNSIGRLKSVKRLDLYGSSLVRLPHQIGGMAALREIDPYTSYRLHWYPFELTRCKNLVASRVSTRALYGNRKYRLPFPDLRANGNRAALEMTCPNACSVCDGPFSGPVKPCWISVGIATDVLPLLVYACSNRCIDALPRPPDKYVGTPHLGGRALQQPEPY